MCVYVERVGSNLIPCLQLHQIPRSTLCWYFRSDPKKKWDHVTLTFCLYMESTHSQSKDGGKRGMWCGVGEAFPESNWDLLAAST
jgi:hypothetical protein